jgi:hypothetical protein
MNTFWVMYALCLTIGLLCLTRAFDIYVVGHEADNVMVAFYWLGSGLTTVSLWYAYNQWLRLSRWRLFCAFACGLVSFVPGFGLAVVLSWLSSRI